MTGASSRLSSTAAAPGAFNPRSLVRGNGALVAIVLIVAFNALFTRNFFSPQTLSLNLTQVCTIVIVATGMTLVIATGGIDLSVGSLMAISGALAPMIFMGKIVPVDNIALGVAAAIALSIFCTGIFGLFNGWLVSRFAIQPIVATLVLFISGRGIAQVLTNGNLQTFHIAQFQWIGLSKVAGIPAQVIIMAVLVVGIAG